MNAFSKLSSSGARGSEKEFNWNKLKVQSDAQAHSNHHLDGVGFNWKHNASESSQLCANIITSRSKHLDALFSAYTFR